MITIIGAGLAGLSLAYRLKQAGLDATILEANSVAGGRIQPAPHSMPTDHTSHQDLGPTWIWPYAQPVAKKWIDELGLSVFEQYDSGAGLIDHSVNEPAQQRMLQSQYGSVRITGGTHAIVQALLSHVKDAVHYEHEVLSGTYQKEQWQLSVKATQNKKTSTNVTTATHVVIATPLRLAATLLEPEREQAHELLRTLSSVETWMAPHAKVVAFYDTPFWRSSGLSGRIASQVGPLVETHDHCGPDGTPAALFGFSGVPAAARAANKDAFIDAVRAQLARCFGDAAPAPTSIVIRDWAFEPYTTTELDRNGSGQHPQLLHASVRQAHFNNTLWFAASETASVSPGLIEGAFARADQLAEELIRSY